MAITTAVAELLKSFYELLVSVLGTAYAVVHGIFMTIFNFAHGLFTLAGDILGGIFNITSGVGKFVLSNIVVVSIGALIAFAFMRYTAQGQRVATGKKTN